MAFPCFYIVGALQQQDLGWQEAERQLAASWHMGKCNQCFLVMAFPLTSFVFEPSVDVMACLERQKCFFLSL